MEEKDYSVEVSERSQAQTDHSMEFSEETQANTDVNVLIESERAYNRAFSELPTACDNNPRTSLTLERYDAPMMKTQTQFVTCDMYFERCLGARLGYDHVSICACTKPLSDESASRQGFAGDEMSFVFGKSIGGMMGRSLGSTSKMTRSKSSTQEDQPSPSLSLAIECDGAPLRSSSARTAAASRNDSLFETELWSPTGRLDLTVIS
ncbi:hypothetical protein LTR39_003037 [Cryomyces antarcticus]|nr:hypothetical protein LTR39_003037 [Cryomyces antarcticus]